MSQVAVSPSFRHQPKLWGFQTTCVSHSWVTVRAFSLPPWVDNRQDESQDSEQCGHCVFFMTTV